MIFFFDRNIAERHARIINAFDSVNTIVHQDEDARFSPVTPDVELIAALSAERPKPVFITADEHIRKRPDERSALWTSELTIVFFARGWHDVGRQSGTGFHEQAVRLLRIWPQIVRATNRVKRPTVFEIKASFRKVDPLGPTNQI